MPEDRTKAPPNFSEIASSYKLAGLAAKKFYTKPSLLAITNLPEATKRVDGDLVALHYVPVYCTCDKNTPLGLKPDSDQLYCAGCLYEAEYCICVGRRQLNKLNTISEQWAIYDAYNAWLAQAQKVVPPPIEDSLKWTTPAWTTYTSIPSKPLSTALNADDTALGTYVWHETMAGIDKEINELVNKYTANPVLMGKDAP